VTVKGVLLAGVRVDGDGVQVLGGALEPAIQLSAMELVYPFNALAVPLNAAVCPTKSVIGELETVI
jgi:hypothetical protein